MTYGLIALALVGGSVFVVVQFAVGWARVKAADDGAHRLTYGDIIRLPTVSSPFHGEASNR